MFFCFVQKFVSDNTRVRIFIFFPEFNIRLYDKNSESNYFFFPPPKSEYFFQQHWESEYFFQVRWLFPYWKYIENIIFDLPIKDSNQHQYSDFKPKKLFNYFKSIRKDNSGISPLKKDGILHTDTVEKTNILNQQFQSVLTHDPPHDIPDKGPSPHPIMEQIHINDKGVLNLLNNLYPHKACGPDNINGRVMKDLKDQVAPI